MPSSTSSTSKQAMQQPCRHVEGTDLHYGLGFDVLDIGQRRTVGPAPRLPPCAGCTLSPLPAKPMLPTCSGGAHSARGRPAAVRPTSYRCLLGSHARQRPSRPLGVCRHLQCRVGMASRPGSAVHDDLRTGDIGGAIGEQEGDHFGNLFGQTDP